MFSTRRSLEFDSRGFRIRKVPPPVPPKRSMSLPVTPPLEQGPRLGGGPAVESSSARDFRRRDPSPARYAILLMGATGAGKSSFIAAATGYPVKIGHTLDPCTRDVEEYTITCRDGTKIALIDTPGFNDLHMSDMEVLQSIVDYTVSKSQKVIAAMYLHKILDKKITGSAMINLRMLRAVCGEHFFQNIAVVTSMWSAISLEGQQDADKRETELNTMSGFWNDMLRKGGLYYRWDEAPASHTAASRHPANARQIVEDCKNNCFRKDGPIPALQIMLELENGLSVEGTSAGQILTEEIRKRQEKERKALAEEEEERLALEREQIQLEERLHAAKDEACRQDRERASNRMYGGHQEVVIVPQGRPSGPRPAEGGRFERNRRPGRRDGRSRADSNYEEDDQRFSLRPSMRRHQTDRESGRHGWLRSFGL